MGRAVVLRIEPPLASRPYGRPSLTPPAWSGLRAPLAQSVSVGGEGGLAVPFTVSRRSRRQGLRAVGACGRGRLRPCDGLRCAVLRPVPGNSA